MRRTGKVLMFAGVIFIGQGSAPHHQGQIRTEKTVKEVRADEAETGQSINHQHDATAEQSDERKEVSEKTKAKGEDTKKRGQRKKKDAKRTVIFSPLKFFALCESFGNFRILIM